MDSKAILSSSNVFKLFDFERWLDIACWGFFNAFWSSICKPINLTPNTTYNFFSFQRIPAALKTQPYDLLRWSAAYFRCLSMDVLPPVKPRYEHENIFGCLTKGYLKVLLSQVRMWHDMLILSLFVIRLIKIHVEFLLVWPKQHKKFINKFFNFRLVVDFSSVVMF